MTVHYIKTAIGAAAYGAMARNCGVLAFTPTTVPHSNQSPWDISFQKADLDTAVANVLTACLANTTISTLGDDSAGSINVAVLTAATSAALFNVQVPPTAAPTSTLLVELAVNIATLWGAWQSNIAAVAGTLGNFIRNSIGAAAYEALSINKGASSILKSSVETDLDDQVAAIMTACHANANILALESSSEGAQNVKVIGAATFAILSNLGTDGLHPSDYTALAALIYETYQQIISVIGTNTDFCSTAAGTAAYASMAADRGLSGGVLSEGQPTDGIQGNAIAVLVGMVRAYIAGCNANSTFSGYGNSTAGSILTQAIEAATSIALTNLDIESIVNIITVVPTTKLTAVVAMVVALITEINTAIT
jgi:hypothetical protein